MCRWSRQNESSCGLEAGGILARERGELFAGVGEFGIVRQVFHFERVGLGIEEHGSIFAVLTEFGVTVIFGADGDAVESGAIFAPDGEGGIVPLGGGVIEERDEGGAFVARRNSETAEFAKGGVNVE